MILIRGKTKSGRDQPHEQDLLAELEARFARITGQRRKWAGHYYTFERIPARLGTSKSVVGLAYRRATRGGEFNPYGVFAGLRVGAGRPP